MKGSSGMTNEFMTAWKSQEGTKKKEETTMDSNVVSIHPTKERSSFFPSLMRLERFKSNRQNSQVFPESYSLLLNAIQDFANFKLDVSGLVST